MGDVNNFKELFQIERVKIEKSIIIGNLNNQKITEEQYKLEIEDVYNEESLPIIVSLFDEYNDLYNEKVSRKLINFILSNDYFYKKYKGDIELFNKIDYMFYREFIRNGNKLEILREIRELQDRLLKELNNFSEMYQVIYLEKVISLLESSNNYKQIKDFSYINHNKEDLLGVNNL